MKIAIFHNLPSGGAKRTLFEVVQRLVARHEISVFTLSCANHEFADLRPLVNHHEIVPFQPSPKFNSPFGRINMLGRLFDLIRLRAVENKLAHKMSSLDFDVVFVNPCQFENSPSLLTFLQDVPSVFFLQEPLRILYEEMPARPYDKKKAGLRRLVDSFDPLPGLYRSVLRKNDIRNVLAANLVLVNSTFVRDSAKMIYGVEATVNYLGVDTQFFHPIAGDKHPTVVSVGSLTPLKGFDFIIRSIAHIPNEKRPTLKIASNFSNPPEYEYLNNLAQALKVDLVFQKEISDQSLVKLYNQAALTVYAPIREPFGLVALESMACATPVVGVREGGIQETVVDHKTGRLTSRNEVEFAEAIQELLNDRKKAAEYSRNGRALMLERWTWEAATERLESNFLAAI